MHSEGYRMEDLTPAEHYDFVERALRKVGVVYQPLLEIEWPGQAVHMCSMELKNVSWALGDAIRHFNCVDRLKPTDHSFDAQCTLGTVLDFLQVKTDCILACCTPHFTDYAHTSRSQLKVLVEYVVLGLEFVDKLQKVQPKEED